ncbi:MAG: Nif3-like dinuclear metal center hexameric protein [Bythopirellula sp.]
MPTIGDVATILEQFAPTALAEDWDNVGLLVGDPEWPARRAMTCLTITPSSVAEAIEAEADLVVAHHPLPFQPLKTITPATTAGKLLLDLISAKIGVYSPHTAFDSAPTGINQHLAIGLGLQQIEPLVPATGTVEADIGAGRVGLVTGESTIQEFAERVKNFLNISSLRVVGNDEQSISRVAIACGSGGSFLSIAIESGCDCLVTGETSFHTCLEAEARGVGLILPGHFASEHFALLSLAEYLQEQLTGIEVWASNTEKDPLRSL